MFTFEIRFSHALTIAVSIFTKIQVDKVIETKTYLSFYKLWLNIELFCLFYVIFFLLLLLLLNRSDRELLIFDQRQHHFFCLFLISSVNTFLRLHSLPQTMWSSQQWYEFIFSNHKNDIPIKKILFEERERKKSSAWVYNQIKKQKWKTSSTKATSTNYDEGCCLCHMTSTCNIQDYFHYTQRHIHQMRVILRWTLAALAHTLCIWNLLLTSFLKR